VTLSLPTYRALKAHLQARFGERVHRVTVRGGFTCPNRDGRRGTGGCAYCSPEVAAAPPPRDPGHPSQADSKRSESLGRSSPIGPTDVVRQLETGMERVGRRFAARKFLAYFNDYTATYDAVDRLRGLFFAALTPPRVVGLAVGTRPDSLPDDVMALLQELHEKTYLWVELGLQTANDETLRRIGRGHDSAAFVEAAEKLGDAGIRVCAHVILGLPGETSRDDLKTAQLLRRLPICGVKIHNLHILEGSPWAKAYQDGKIGVPSQEEYVARTVDFLENLAPHVVVHRLVASAPRRSLMAPEWCLKKNSSLESIRKTLQKRKSWQGKALGAPIEALSQHIAAWKHHQGSTKNPSQLV
jgi:uncharacterized protein